MKRMGMARLALGAVVCMLLLASATCEYLCLPSNCKPPACMCASTEPPLQPASAVPQFIVLTNDDAATIITTPAVLSVLDKHTNRNGCPLPATWFISIQYTQPEYVQQLYMKTHEIATHTIDHVALPNATEIVGARTWLNQTANVPLEKIRGFRGPFLAHNEEQRDILAANGFGYDSTITSSWGPNSISNDSGHKVWPFTMGFGVPIDCTVGTGTCSLTESHPGLWEFPLWDVQGDDGNSIASMDPVGNITELYIRELLRNYRGNRAPLGLYLHAARLLTQEVADQYSAFLTYALSLPDVWVVTVSEVLRWMVNPVPASQYSLSCPTPTDMHFPGGRFCLPPTGGCVQGTWNAGTCSCLCLNQFNASLSGFCPDPETGVCSVVKSYGIASRIFYCPTTAGTATDDVTLPVTAPPSSSTPSSPAAATGSSTTQTSPTAATGSSAPTSPAATTSSSQASTPASSNAAETTTAPTVSSSSVGISLTPATTAATASASGVADIQPLGGVHFAFDVQGQLSSFVQSQLSSVVNMERTVCGVVADFAGEPAGTCSIASITEAAAPGTAGITGTVARRKLASTGYLHIILAIQPVLNSEGQVSAALTAALQDGRLAAGLQAIGVELVSTNGSGGSADVLSAAPSDSKATIAAAVGGAVGGGVAVGVAVAVFLVVRSRRANASAAGQHHKTDLPTPFADGAKYKASPPTKGLSLTAKTGPSRLGEGHVSAYASTPRSTATPRHGSGGLDPFGITIAGDESNV